MDGFGLVKLNSGTARPPVLLPGLLPGLQRRERPVTEMVPHPPNQEPTVGGAMPLVEERQVPSRGQECFERLPSLYGELGPASAPGTARAEQPPVSEGEERSTMGDGDAIPCAHIEGGSESEFRDQLPEGTKPDHREGVCRNGLNQPHSVEHLIEELGVGHRGDKARCQLGEC